jgi:hypothetical protein
VNRNHIALVLGFLFCALQAPAGELPRGWSEPTAKEVSGAWRDKNASRFLVVRGDFDGDGKPDEARILVNDTEFGIFVWLGSSRQLLLLDSGARGSLGNQGIAKTKRGTYKTACGKGYGEWACAHGEPKTLRLTRDAIDLFEDESGDAVFYWDANTQKFNRVQMSD